MGNAVGARFLVGAVSQAQQLIDLGDLLAVVDDGRIEVLDYLGQEVVDGSNAIPAMSRPESCKLAMKRFVVHTR